MSTDPMHLLRMLEPVVRPKGAPTPAAAAQQPWELQSFDQLLAKVDASLSQQQTQNAMPQQTEAAPQPTETDKSLSILNATHRIENASLMRAIAQHSPSNEPTGANPERATADDFTVQQQTRSRR